MEHVVFFTENPGEPEFRRVGELEEAVRLVERLRNERGIAEVSVHALTPVPVSFRTYYRVEIGGADGQPMASSEAAERPATSVEPTVEVAPVADPEVPVAEVLQFEVPGREALALEAVAFGVDGFCGEFETPSEESELEVPSLEVLSFEVPSLADEAPAFAPLSLLPPPVEASPVFDLDEPSEEPVASFESVASFEPVASFAGVAESEAEQADELEALDSYEPLVPQVRAEPEAERSLGYFAN